MRLLYVPVSQDALDTLVAQARLEHRRPQDQAAVLLERALGLRSCECDHAARRESEGQELAVCGR